MLFSSFPSHLDLWRKYLHNCVVDSRVELNVMPLRLMMKLWLQINSPCYEIFGLDTNLPTWPIGIIKNVEFYVFAELMIEVLVDIVVINVPETYGMFL